MHRQSLGSFILCLIILGPHSLVAQSGGPAFFAGCLLEDYTSPEIFVENMEIAEDGGTQYIESTVTNLETKDQILMTGLLFGVKLSRQNHPWSSTVLHQTYRERYLYTSISLLPASLREKVDISYYQSASCPNLEVQSVKDISTEQDRTLDFLIVEVVWAEEDSDLLLYERHIWKQKSSYTFLYTVQAPKRKILDQYMDEWMNDMDGIFVY